MSRDAEKPSTTDASAFYRSYFAALSETGTKFLVVGDMAENYLLNGSNRPVQKLEVWLDPTVTRRDEGKVWERLREKLDSEGTFSADLRHELFNTLVVKREQLHLPVAFERAYSTAIPGVFGDQAVNVIRGEDLVAMKMASPNRSEVEDGRRLLRALREDEPKLDREPDSLNTTFAPKMKLN